MPFPWWGRKVNYPRAQYNLGAQLKENSKRSSSTAQYAIVSY